LEHQPNERVLLEEKQKLQTSQEERHEGSLTALVLAGSLATATVMLAVPCSDGGELANLSSDHCVRIIQRMVRSIVLLALPALAVFCTTTFQFGAQHHKFQFS
jgi:hypothetical protein